MLTTFRRIALVLSIALALAFFARAATADGYLGKTVRIKLKDGSQKPVVGKVIFEGSESLDIKLAYGRRSISKDEIESIDDIEPLIKEYEAKLKAASSGDELYKVAQWAKEKELESKLYYDALRATIAKEPNHEAARKELGYEKSVDARGNISWVNKAEAKTRTKVEGSIKKAESELGHRNWDDVKVTVRLPEKKPEYEIISNCPKEVAERYCSFMVSLKGSLCDLIQKTIGAPIAWQRVQCTTCSGTGKEGTHTCPRCGGSTQEPSKIYILNNQKLFMELTGKPEGVGGFYVPFFYPPADCERPIVCFHGTFGLSGNTFSVLGHEGTHQLEHLMWKGNFNTRPPWMVEGLAVYFGDGLDLSGMDKTPPKFAIEIPRDRLSGLKRFIKTGHNASVHDFTLCQYQAYMQNPILYNHAWSLIYYMLHSGQSLEFKGKKHDLKVAFKEFFLKNTEEGFPILAQYLGAENEADMQEVLSKLDSAWKEWVMKLPIKSVYTTKGNKYVADELCFELGVPKKKKGFEWSAVPDEELGWGEALRLSCGDGFARLLLMCEQNSKVLDVVANEGQIVDEQKRVFQNRFADFKILKRTPITHNGLAAIELEMTCKEREHPFLSKPRADEQHIRCVIFATPKRVYTVMLMCDKGKLETAQPELDEVFKTFRLTGG